ncbi:MAG TPA: hypothetical protein VJ142_00945 [Candidatus Nanoarchaeia archaeon]|nr:hypothetical protein [Candidatus Nanoarchaeia archaeon]
MGPEPTSPLDKTENIDLHKLRELREEARRQRELEVRVNFDNFIKSEKAKVRALIPLLSGKLEEAARKDHSNCELLVASVEKDITKEELMKHPAYGELIRYLETQGLTHVHTGFYRPENGGVRLYVTLP